MNNNLSDITYLSREYLKFRQYGILDFFFKLAIFGTLSFLIMHYIHEDSHALTILNLVAFVCAVSLFLDLKINTNTQRSAWLSVSIVFVFFIYFIYINQNEGSGVVWIAFTPIYAVALLGWKRGVYISAVFFLIVFYMAFDGIGVWNEGLWNIQSFLRLVLSSLSIFMLVVMMDIILLKAYKKLEVLSMTDPLTGAYNRRKGLDVLGEEISKSKRSKENLALILLDIDDFKKINDSYGHDVGDKVLQNLIQLLNENVRLSDSLIRWGGEEFLIIIPNIEGKDMKSLANKLRNIVFNSNFEVVDHSISCSFGVATYIEGEEPDKFINRADEAMYQAKRAGKNCVVEL